MCTVKTQKHRFPFIIISNIVPNDTLIHVALKFSRRLVSAVVHAFINNTVQE